MSKLLSLCVLLLCCESLFAASRVDELFDRNDFVENPKISEKFWSNKANTLYGKSVIAWNGDDFDALEDRLQAQLLAERQLYLAEVEKRGSIGVNERIGFESRRANLEATLRTLPEIRAWVDIARSGSDGGWDSAPSDLPKSPANIVAAGSRNSFDEYVLTDPDTKKADESSRLKEYIAREGAAWQRKRTILIYAAVGAFSLILGVLALFWYRRLRFPDLKCPRCKTTDRKQISSSSTSSGSFSLFKSKVRRKFYCNACGFKWIQKSG